jgi:hypothetical protein
VQLMRTGLIVLLLRNLPKCGRGAGHISYRETPTMSGYATVVSSEQGNEFSSFPLSDCISGPP